MKLRLALLAAALMMPHTSLSAQQAQPQRPLTAVVPDAITVGDVFHAAIRVTMSGPGDVAAPDSLVLPQDVESAGRREIQYDTVNGAMRATILYPLAAWRPGTFELPDVNIRVVTDGAGETALTADLPSFTVRSVLPQDTAGIEPKAARDVLGPNRVWWPILLALLVLLLAAIAAWVYWKRRRGVDEAVVFTPSIPPRDHALAQLEALRRDALHERGDVRLYYERLTAILRHYAAALEPEMSVDLTTAELTTRVRAQGTIAEDSELIRILGSADLVKFARATVPAAAAARDLDAARSWVERPRTEPDPELDPDADAAGGRDVGARAA